MKGFRESCLSTKECNKFTKRAVRKASFNKERGLKVSLRTSYLPESNFLLDVAPCLAGRSKVEQTEDKNNLSFPLFNPF
jgi:hypothetical protein